MTEISEELFRYDSPHYLFLFCVIIPNPFFALLIHLLYFPYIMSNHPSSIPHIFYLL